MAPPTGSRAGPGGPRLRAFSGAGPRGSASSRRPGASKKGGRATGAGGGGGSVGGSGGPAVAAADEPGAGAPGLGTPDPRLSRARIKPSGRSRSLHRAAQRASCDTHPSPSQLGVAPALGGGSEVGEAAPPLAPPPPGPGERAAPPPPVCPSSRGGVGGRGAHITLPSLRSEPPLSPPSCKHHRLSCHRRHLARRSAARRGRWAVRGSCAPGAPDVQSRPLPVTQPQL